MNPTIHRNVKSSTVCDDAFIIRPQADLLDKHPELKRASNALALKYAFKELVTEEELIKIGQAIQSEAMGQTGK